MVPPPGPQRPGIQNYVHSQAPSNPTLIPNRPPISTWNGVCPRNSLSSLPKMAGFISVRSGAVLGKLLVGDILKNQMTPGLKEKFLEQFNLTPAEIIDRVYRKPFPNRFLASFSPFLVQHLDEPVIRELVLNSFKKFLKRNVMQYDYQHAPVHFIGSVAFYYRELLSEACKIMGVHLGTIIQSPMEGLIKFHE